MSIIPLKRFGQHFLTDEEISTRIVDAAALSPEDIVWEIGPGKGILTGKILERTQNVTAFEIDRRLAGYLKRNLSSQLNVINKDILSVNWQEMLEQTVKPGEPVKLISNLPYQITSPVLYLLQENARWFCRVVLMLQKEVAERLTAKPGTKAYGPLTLKLAYAFCSELLFTVPPSAFNPPPNVHSAVMLFLPSVGKPQVKSLDSYWRIINQSFMHRRKTLRNNLRSIMEPDLLKKLEKVSTIDFDRRGETLDEAEFSRLADCYAALADDCKGSKQ